MKKLKSIGIILISFFVITAFVKNTQTNEISDKTTEDIISVVNNARNENDIKENISENPDLYHGYRGDYEFKNKELIQGKDGKEIVILSVDYTNTTNSQTLPLFSFYLDTNIYQVNNGVEEKLQNSKENLPDEYNISLENETKVKPGQKVSILVPIQLNSDGNTLEIKDLVTNGEEFSKTLEI